MSSAVLPATLHPEIPGLVRVSRPSDALAAKRATEATFSALISVLERRKEIGLRRALGANRGRIRAQFLTESVALSVLGGVAGTVLGVAATLAYATYQGRPPVIPVASIASIAAGTVGAVVIGMAAGGYPSVRASRLTPTEALATVRPGRSGFRARSDGVRISASGARG